MNDYLSQAFKELKVNTINDPLTQDCSKHIIANIATKKSNGAPLVEESSNYSSTDLTSMGDGITDGVSSDPSNQYRPLSMLLARRVIPSLFAHKLVGVQPLDKPVGVAFALRTVYNEEDTDGETAVEAGWDKVDEYGGFTGASQNTTISYDYSYLEWDDVSTEYTETTVSAATSSPDIDLFDIKGENFDANGASTNFPTKDDYIRAQLSLLNDAETAYLSKMSGKNSQTVEGWEVNNENGYNTDSAGGDTPDGIVDSFSDNKWPELRDVYDRKTIDAKERRLAASFSLNALEDAKAFNQIDLKAEMVTRLQAEVTSHIDREILQNIKRTALDIANGGAAPAQIDLTNTGEDTRSTTAKVLNAIIYASNVIAKKARRGRGNFAVVSTGVASIIQSAQPYFTSNTGDVDPGIILSGSETTEIGTINNAITVYLDQHATTEYAIVGYKGPDSRMDSGIIFSPYSMNVTKEATAQENFEPRIGVRSRYAITTSLLSAGSYYRYISFKGINKVTGIATDLIGW